MATRKRAAAGKSGAAPRKKAASAGKKAPKRKHPLLKLFSFLAFLTAATGAGLWQIGEKYADSLPYYQQLRAQAYFLKDRLLMVPDPTISIRTPEDALNSPYDNLSLGVPGMTDAVIDRRGYALGYSEQYEQPLWVAYTLTAEEVLEKTVSRTDDFRVDPYISTGSARAEDYAKSGFDRGHLAPAADMGWARKAMSESFYYSNMSPQQPEFNRGIWKKLEEKVRDWAVDHGEIHVITGPVFARSNKVIGRNNVAVPQACYKVVYAPKAKPPAMIGFILPNAGSDRKLYEFAVSVDTVESVTGLSFFTAVDGNLRRRLASGYDIDAWKWTPNRQ